MLRSGSIRRGSRGVGWGPRYRRRRCWCCIRRSRAQLSMASPASWRWEGYKWQEGELDLLLSAYVR